MDTLESNARGRDDLRGSTTIKEHGYGPEGTKKGKRATFPKLQMLWSMSPVLPVVILTKDWKYSGGQSREQRLFR